jgi:hypothetical protein
MESAFAERPATADCACDREGELGRHAWLRRGRREPEAILG